MQVKLPTTAEQKETRKFVEMRDTFRINWIMIHELIEVSESYPFDMY